MKEEQERSSAEGLGNRAAKSLVLSGLLRIAIKGIGFLRMAIIARVLAPGDFGLYGIALVFLNIMEVLSRPGIVEALVQRESDDMDYIDVSLTMKFIRGSAMSLIMVLLSPSVSKYFGDQRVQPIINILALGVFIGGLGNPAIIYWTRELRMEYLCVYELAGQLMDISVAIVLVYLTHSPIAMAWGYSAGIAVMCVLSYALHPYFPKFRWDRKKMKKLMGYGKWIWGDNMLYFALLQSVSLYVAKVLGTAALGLFQVAQKLVNTVTIDLALVFSSIAFPLFSRLRSEQERLRSAFSVVLFLTNGVVIPFSWLLFRFGTEIVSALFGAQWVAAAAVVKVLAVYCILASLSSLHRSVLNAVGRPDSTTIFQGAKFIVAVILIVPASRWSGLEGVAWAMVASSLAVFPFEVRMVRQLSPMWYGDLVKPLLSTTGAMLAGEIGYSTLHAIGGFNISVPVRAAVAFAIYGTIMWILDMRGNKCIPLCVSRIKILMFQGG